MSLKAQLDDLAAEKSVLKAKADGLVDEVARLKAESTKAQELANQRHLEAESREKDLHQRLQTSLDIMCGKPLLSLK
jgi:regulator of replication initiation timing